MKAYLVKLSNIGALGRERLSRKVTFPKDWKERPFNWLNYMNVQVLSDIEACAYMVKLSSKPQLSDSLCLWWDCNVRDILVPGWVGSLISSLDGVARSQIVPLVRSIHFLGPFGSPPVAPP